MTAGVGRVQLNKSKILEIYLCHGDISEFYVRSGAII
jgi:hypothetical protein